MEENEVSILKKLEDIETDKISLDSKNSTEYILQFSNTTNLKNELENIYDQIIKTKNFNVSLKCGISSWESKIAIKKESVKTKMTNLETLKTNYNSLRMWIDHDIKIEYDVLLTKFLYRVNIEIPIMNLKLIETKTNYNLQLDLNLQKKEQISKLEFNVLELTKLKQKTKSKYDIKWSEFERVKLEIEDKYELKKRNFQITKIQSIHRKNICRSRYLKTYNGKKII